MESPRTCRLIQAYDKSSKPRASTSIPNSLCLTDWTPQYPHPFFRHFPTPTTYALPSSAVYACIGGADLTGAHPSLSHTHSMEKIGHPDR